MIHGTKYLELDGTWPIATDHALLKLKILQQLQCQLTIGSVSDVKELSPSSYPPKSVNLVTKPHIMWNLLINLSRLTDELITQSVVS